jgi:hypothetical protein
MMDATRVRTFRDRYVTWQAQGPAACVADALARAGLDRVGRVAQLGCAYFESRPNFGSKTLRELVGRAKGAPDRRPSDVIAVALSLSLPPDDARETLADAVIAPRRNGLRPTAFKSEQVR